MAQWSIQGFTYASAEYSAQAILRKALNRASSVPVEKLKLSGRWRDSTTPMDDLNIALCFKPTRALLPVELPLLVEVLSVPCGERQYTCQS